MKHLALRLCVALVTFTTGLTVGKLVPSVNFKSAHAVPTTQAEREVLNVEDAYVAAHLNRDAAALERILADDFTFYFPFGAAQDKPGRLALVGDPDFTFLSIDRAGVRVAVDGDRATVSGRAQVRVSRRAYNGDGDEHFSPWYNFVRTYERRDGRWQIISVRTARFYRGCRD